MRRIRGAAKSIQLHTDSGVFTEGDSCVGAGAYGDGIRCGDSEGDEPVHVKYYIAPAQTPPRARREIIMMLLTELMSTRFVLRARCHEGPRASLLSSLAKSLGPLWIAFPAWRQSIDEFLMILLDIDAAVLMIRNDMPGSISRQHTGVQPHHPVSVTAVLHDAHRRGLLPLIFASNMRGKAPFDLGVPASMTTYDACISTGEGLDFAMWNPALGCGKVAFTVSGLPSSLLSMSTASQQQPACAKIIQSVTIFTHSRSKKVWQRSTFGDAGPVALARSSLLDWGLDPVARTHPNWRCNNYALPTRIGVCPAVGLQAYVYPPAFLSPECVRVLVVRRTDQSMQQDAQHTTPGLSLYSRSPHLAVSHDQSRRASDPVITATTGTDGYLHMSTCPPFCELNCNLDTAELLLFQRGQIRQVRAIQRVTLELVLDVELGVEASLPDVLGSKVTRVHWLSRWLESACVANGGAHPEPGNTLQSALHTFVSNRGPTAPQQPAQPAVARNSRSGVRHGEQQASSAFAFGNLASTSARDWRPLPDMPAALTPSLAAFTFGTTPSSSSPTITDLQTTSAGVSALFGDQSSPAQERSPCDDFKRRGPVFSSAIHDTWTWEVAGQSGKSGHAMWLAE